MDHWYIKEFGMMMKVSVRTLHHYDAIGLLEPSLRMSNGYRLYSKDDMLKLQQILALKFYGFKLIQIKKMMEKGIKSLDQLPEQHLRLGTQIAELQKASRVVGAIISDCEENQPIDWEMIVQLTKEYRMIEDKKNALEGKGQSKNRLKQFTQVRSQLTEKQMEEFQERWMCLIEDVKKHLEKDPAGADGKRLAEDWVGLINFGFGKYPKLKEAIHQAYENNQILWVNPGHRAARDWINKAVDAAGIDWRKINKEDGEV